MKIGEFASSNNISIDTVRHYVELGFILPARKGAQSVYDGQCAADLSEVLELKEMGLTLNEIKSVFTFKRLGRLTAYQENPAYLDIFKNRYRQLAAGIEELQHRKSKLENRLAEFNRQAAGGCRHGFDFRGLDLFCCAACGGELALLEARIADNLITDARLGCKCGRECSIADGILFAGGAEREAGGFDEKRIAEYIETTDEAYLRNVYRGLDWLRRKLDLKSSGNKVLLELGSGYGFFLRHIYEDLPENTAYIAVDRDINSHRLLKQMLEKAPRRKNIFLVCSDFLELPLKGGAADFVLDLSGTSNYSFEHEEFLPEKMAGYFKAGAELLGNYIIFGNFAADTLVEERFRKNFKPGSIKRMLESSGFEIIDEATGEYLEKAGKFENYFKKGERVNSYSLHAKRRG